MSLRLQLVPELLCAFRLLCILSGAPGIGTGGLGAFELDWWVVRGGGCLGLGGGAFRSTLSWSAQRRRGVSLSGKSWRLLKSASSTGELPLSLELPEGLQKRWRRASSVCCWFFLALPVQLAQVWIHFQVFPFLRFSVKREYPTM